MDAERRKRVATLACELSLERHTIIRPLHQGSLFELTQKWERLGTR